MVHRLGAALVVLGALAACGGPAPEPAAVPGAASAAAPAAAAASFRAVDVQGLKADLDAGKVPLLLDVRTDEEYVAGHVAQTRHIPLDTLESRLAELEAHKGAEIYVICQSGRRSERASQLLLSKGFTPVNVEGGTGAWVSAGMPVVEGAAPSTP
ncbi:MAG: Thiosulfate sulfurtransferase GlpE [Pseudomonadota bacterium]